MTRIISKNRRPHFLLISHCHLYKCIDIIVNFHEFLFILHTKERIHARFGHKPMTDAQTHYKN